MASTAWRVSFRTVYTLSVKEDHAVDNGDQDKEKEKGANRDRIWNPGGESRE